MMIFGLTATAIATAVPSVESAGPLPLGVQAQREAYHATAGEIFRLADELNSRGQAGQAEELFELLAHDPDPDVRNEARFRHSKILKAQGHWTEAALLLRRIVDEKPAATPVRLELAQVLEQLGDTDGAWRQVRAAQAAGLPPAVARLVDRYSEALRSSRSSGMSLEFAFAPDSNINHATHSDKLGTVLGDFEIDKEGQAKSGMGIALRSQAYQRFRLGEGAPELLVRGGVTADLYKKSRFNDISIDVGTGPEFEIGRNRLNLEVGASQRWYGQEPFVRILRAGASWLQPIGRLSQLRVVGSASLVDNRNNDLEDGKTFFGQISFEHALSATTGVALTGWGNREALNDPGHSTTAWRLRALGWRDVGRTTLTVSGDYGRLAADDRLSLFPDKREDRFMQLSIAATFRQLGLWGFAPVARFTLERNHSSIEFYDYARRRAELGVQRAF
jgi:hypothetical protein